MNFHYLFFEEVAYFLVKFCVYNGNYFTYYKHYL